MWADNPNDNSIDKVRLLQKKMLNAELQMDEVMFGTLIKTYLRARRPQDAETVLGEMAEAGVAPGVVAWTSVISAWVNAADMNEVRRCDAPNCSVLPLRPGLSPSWSNGGVSPLYMLHTPV